MKAKIPTPTKVKSGYANMEEAWKSRAREKKQRKIKKIDVGQNKPN